MLVSETPTPIKAVMNMTTQVDTAAFNPHGQILAVASRMKKDALKMVRTRCLRASIRKVGGKERKDGVVVVGCCDCIPLR